MKKKFFLIIESLKFAFNALLSSKLRTLLSLLGVSIGIFCIITVLAAVDSLKQNVLKEVNSYGQETVYITIWPWGMNFNVKWWEIAKRPNPTLKEFEALKKKMPDSEDRIAYLISRGGQKVKVNGEPMEGLQIYAVSKQYDKVEQWKIAKGRSFTDMEHNEAKNVCMIGSDIYENAFSSDSDAIGKNIFYNGQKLLVIGTLKKEGEQNFSNQKDNRIIIPINFYKKFNIINERTDGMIVVVPNQAQQADLSGFLDEIRGNMRAIRRLSPDVADNFELNVPSMVAQSMEGLFISLNIAGVIIGGFSMLVGGFGIANIMFVSVTERTAQIGIQKSLGAKSSFILSQFIFEAMFLSVLGGIIGLLMVWGVLSAAQAATNTDFYLSVDNILIGFVVSCLIGLVSGIVPAYKAARLNPVDAIRTSI